jgi:hypothetical protein
MDYLLITVIFLLNLLCWRYALPRWRTQILQANPVTSYALTFIVSVLIPYVIAIAAFYLFELDLGILSHFFLVFVIVMLSVSIFRRL